MITEQEIKAIEIADKNYPFLSEDTMNGKVEWLFDECKELLDAWHRRDFENMEEEIGDVAFLLLHIASHINKEKGLFDYLNDAKNKMIFRSIHGKTAN